MTIEEQPQNIWKLEILFLKLDGTTIEDSFIEGILNKINDALNDTGIVFDYDVWSATTPIIQA